MKSIMNEGRRHVEIESANDLSMNMQNYVIQIPVGDIVTIGKKDIRRIHLCEDAISIWFADGTHANFKVMLE